MAVVMNRSACAGTSERGLLSSAIPIPIGLADVGMGRDEPLQSGGLQRREPPLYTCIRYYSAVLVLANRIAADVEALT